MPFDPNQVTPCGLTYAQIDEKEAAYVLAANNALSELPGLGCRWWNYSVSHRTFELVVGDPLARSSNLVFSLAACEQIAGPVNWPDQQLKVIWHNDREAEKPWVFVLEDESVGFRAVGGVFGWRRDHDLLAQGGLRFGRGPEPEATLTCKQAEASVAKLLRLFDNGLIGHHDLVVKVRGVLEQLPDLGNREDGVAESQER